MPSPTQTIRLINTNEKDNTASKTYSGVNTYSGANVHSGVETHSGAETHSGDETHGGDETHSGDETFSGQTTFDDPISTDFNPLNRVYVRTNFYNRVAHSASLAIFSLPSSTIDANTHWCFSGRFGSQSCLNGTDGGCILYPGSKSISAFVWMRPMARGPLDRINWSVDKAPRFRAIIKPTGAGILQSQIAVGLYSNSRNPDRFSSDAGAQSCSRRIEVFHSSDSSDWKIHCGHSSAADSSSAVTSVAAADGVVADVEIRLDSSRIATVYLNSTLVYTASVPIKTATRLYPIIGIRNMKSSNAAAAKCQLAVYHTEMSQDIA